jgi:hypothetical protein
VKYLSVEKKRSVQKYKTFSPEELLKCSVTDLIKYTKLKPGTINKSWYNCKNITGNYNVHRSLMSVNKFFRSKNPVAQKTSDRHFQSGAELKALRGWRKLTGYLVVCDRTLH